MLLAIYTTMRKKNNLPADDERTIANMDVEGMPWYSGHKRKRNSTKQQQIILSKAERKAMMRGAFMAILPIVFGFVFLYFLAFLFLEYVWLK